MFLKKYILKESFNTFVMTLTEQHIIKKCHPNYKELDDFLVLTKNLYNHALFLVIEHYKETKEYLNYYKVNDLLKNLNQHDYRALPNNVAQQVLMLLDRNYKSFFGKLKLKLSGQTNERLNAPKFLTPYSRCIATFTCNNFSIPVLKKEGLIKLSGLPNFRCPTERKDIQQVRLIPRNNRIVLEIVYRVQEKELLQDNGKYLGIDLGINNLATCVSSEGNAFIINGKPLKSINQYYNEKTSKLKVLLHQEKDKETNRLVRHKSYRIYNTTNKRNNKIKDYMHKASRKIVDYAVSNHLHTIVVGYNKAWKQGTNMGRINNQKFCCVPFARFIQMIEYKAKLEGIRVIKGNESYTSKCSFFDAESVRKHSTYKGQRTKRGLFETSNGLKVNADVNGALNILNKHVSFDVPLKSPGGIGNWLSPIRLAV